MSIQLINCPFPRVTFSLLSASLISSLVFLYLLRTPWMLLLLWAALSSLMMLDFYQKNAGSPALRMTNLDQLQIRHQGQWITILLKPSSRAFGYFMLLHFVDLGDSKLEQLGQKSLLLEKWQLPDHQWRQLQAYFHLASLTAK